MNISQHGYVKLVNVIMLLRYTYGILFIVAGLDKFFNLITNWGHYVNPMILQHLPVDASHFLMAVGVFEVALGLWLLFRCACSGGYIAAIWLLVIAANLISMHAFYDVAVRDIVMAVGAFALARLTCVKKEIVQ